MRFEGNKQPKWPQLGFVVAWDGACTSSSIFARLLAFSAE